MALTGTHNTGDPGHVADHNLIDNAISTINANLAPLAQAGQTPSQLPVLAAATASVGSLAFAARADHVHPAGVASLPADGFLVNTRSTDTTGAVSLCGPLNSTSSFFSLGRGNAIPIYFAKNAAYVLGANISGSAASVVLRIAVWANDATGGKPGTLVADLGTLDASTTGLKYTSSSFTPTTNTRYWVGIVQQGSTGASANALQKPPFVLPEDSTGTFDAFSYRLSFTGAAASNPTLAAQDSTAYAVYAKLA